MADDIDIEEHNLLDNPRIKMIFPDIASIKTEVPDYKEYEEVTEESERSKHEDFEEETTYCKEETSYEQLEYVNNHSSEAIEYENDLPNLYPNKIILGSKPCTESPTFSENSEPSIQECSIVLQDFGPILNNSPFCSSCQTLFPTQNALDYHKMTSHSFLVAVNNNKAKKSTSKSSISALKFVPNTPIVCNHCNETFPDDNALLKHSYDLIPDKNEGDIEVEENEEHSEGNSNALYISCEICTCIFKYKGYFWAHMINNHGVESEELPDPVVNNLKCCFCPYVARNNVHYNQHICNSHSKLYTKKVKKNNFDTFKCDSCNISFLTAYSQKIHHALDHSDISKIRTQSSLESKEAKLTLSTLRSAYSIPIPKSTLFSCDKCQIHFVSCLAACEHSKRCLLTKGDWKCTHCRLSFKRADREAHLKQHELSSRLKVIKVQEGILDRILCRCLSCNICYDERNLLKYHSFGCSIYKSVACTVCSVRIHEDTIEKHKHSELGPDQHFIIIDFIPDDKRTRKALPEEPTPKKRKLNRVYYYCPSCKLCMKINRKSHSTGNCNKYLPRSLCKFCGLCFTPKVRHSHEEIHKRFPNLKLSDIMFQNIQTGAKIDPPFPDFKKCTHCKVCFFSTVALRNHVCYAEEVKICDYCGDKLSDLAYKLHVPFHEYRKQKKMINELFKKYESLKSIWNILYLCVACDTMLDNYDDVVEHAQDHFCDMQNCKVVINHCDICDLSFMGECYKRHEYLHAGGVSKSSFEIITFNHETLLSDKWLDIFTKLDPEQVDQILKKSIYKDTRSVRMTVLDSKDAEFRLYQCGVCKVMVESNKIIDHTHNRNCIKNTFISCNLCQFKFDSKNALRCHQLLHKNLQIDAEAFKIISFNNEKDVIVNDSLKSVMNPEALKFVRCLHCKKLIKKIKYNRHMTNHRYLDKKNKGKPKKPNFLVHPKFKNPGYAPDSFYKCKLCGVCVLKQNIKTHYCSETNHKKQCDKCLLWFRANHFQKHELYHKKYKFTKDVDVFSFKNGIIESNSIESNSIECTENNMVFYQCIVCKTCLHYKRNIQKHQCLRFKSLRQCNLCEVPFHSSHFYIHEKLHDSKSFSKKDVVIIKFQPPCNIKNKTKALVPKKVKNKKATRFLNKTSLKKVVISKELKRNLKNGNRTDFELTDGNYFKRLYCRVFKCEKCHVLFLTGSALVEHAKICDEDRDSVKCECGLLFHSSALKFHQKWQRCGKSEVTKYYVVTLISENIVDFDLKKCLYTCRTCDIYYLNIHTAALHFADKHHQVNTLTKCEQCNISFSLISNAKHNKFHHKTHNWSLSDLIIFEFNYITLDQIINDFPKDSICNVSFASTANDPSSEGKSVKRKLSEELVVANKVFKIGPKTVSDELTKNLENGDGTNIELIEKSSEMRYMYCRLFKCEKCQVLFLTGSALVKHAKCCDEDRDSVKCKCGLLFHSSALKLHHEWQRCGKRGETKCYIVSLASENIVAFDLRKCLYTCRKCDIYFLTFNSAMVHFEQRHNIKSMYKCVQCNINFTTKSLSRHNKLQHEEHNLSLSDLNIFEVNYTTITQIINDFQEDSIYDDSLNTSGAVSSSEKKSVNRRRFKEPSVDHEVLQNGSQSWSWSGTCDLTNIYKCHICDLSFLHKSTLTTHSFVGRHSEHRMKCICGLSFTTKSLRRHLDAPSDLPLSEIQKLIKLVKKDELSKSQNDEVNPKTGNTLKLFKCSVCEVYFLNDEVCQDHITNHQVLDPTEYIACKICELQFPCEYLGAHMKTHRDKTFNIEDVTVTESDPDKGTQDTYQAIDRLKSKAVSTTTHFDTEDENIV